MTILSFLLTATILCIVHELGHYSCARCFGVSIKEFAIGVGKVMFCITDKYQTRWSIRLLPLGGFVSFDIDKSTSRFLYHEIHVIKRMLIVLAGPIANFIFAVILLISSYSIYGMYTTSPAIIDEVVENSVAEQAGIMSGDLIIKINQIEISNFDQLTKVIKSLPRVPIQILVKRQNELIMLDAIPESETYPVGSNHTEVGVLGVKGKRLIWVKCDIITAVTKSVYYVGMLSKMILTKLAGMFSNRESISEIRGVITIASTSYEALDRGMNVFISFLAMLSVNLGIINLLPVPMLDGGQFLYLAYIAFRGKESVNSEVYNLIIKIGVIVTIFFVVISLSNDIKILYSF